MISMAANLADGKGFQKILGLFLMCARISDKAGLFFQALLEAFPHFNWILMVGRLIRSASISLTITSNGKLSY